MADRNDDVHERLRAARAAFVACVRGAIRGEGSVTEASRGKGDGADGSRDGGPGPDNGKEPEQWMIDEARNGRR